MSITADTIDLTKLTLADGTEVENPPHVTDAEGDTVDREATAELHNSLVDWSEVATRIASAAHGTQPEISTEDGRELRKAYAELSVRGKAFARGFAEDKMRDALMAGGEDAEAFTHAIIWSHIGTVQKEGVEKPRAERRAKVEVSPAERVAEKVATLKLALEYLENNGEDDVEPDEFAELSDAKVEESYNELETYLDWETRDLEEGEEKGEYEGELSPVVRDAARLVLKKGRRPATGGTGRAWTGPRRSPAAHIENAFADKASGEFMTIAEIVAVPSPEYGDDKPSSGAIAARLFPKNGSECTVPGIEPGNSPDGKQGAYKL